LTGGGFVTDYRLQTETKPDSDSDSAAQARAGSAFILAKILSQATSKDNNWQPHWGTADTKEIIFTVAQGQKTQGKQNTNRWM